MRGNMKAYRYLIFDVDDTLLDFGRAFHGAQRDMSSLLGKEYSEEYIKTAEACGYRAWNECGMGDVSSPEVQRNYHTLYYEYLRRQCRYLCQTFESDISEDALTECYIWSISGSRVPMEQDTLEVYRRLSEKYRMVLATNGMTDIQTARTIDFMSCTHSLFISQSVGAIKPTGEFFGHMLDQLGCKAGECLMIGDSLSGDIAGAKAAGMDACWYNPKKKEMRGGAVPDFEICRICELMDILL